MTRVVRGYAQKDVTSLNTHVDVDLNERGLYATFRTSKDNICGENLLKVYVSADTVVIAPSCWSGQSGTCPR